MSKLIIDTGIKMAPNCDPKNVAAYLIRMDYEFVYSNGNFFLPVGPGGDIDGMMKVLMQETGARATHCFLYPITKAVVL